MIYPEKSMVLPGKVYGDIRKSLWCYSEKSMVLRGKVYGVKTRKAA